MEDSIVHDPPSMSLSTMTLDSATYLVGEKVRHLKVKEAPYNLPAGHQVLVKTAAVAVNPVGWAIQDLALFPLTYPNILEDDVAGEVVEVGQSVTKVKKDDRVIGIAIGQVTHNNSACDFQQYTIIRSVSVSDIPHTRSPPLSGHRCRRVVSGRPPIASANISQSYPNDKAHFV